MRTSPVGIAVMGLLAVTTIAHAQTRAAVVVQEGPGTARVYIGRPAISYSKPVLARYGPRVIYVERVGHRGPGWLKRHGYRPVTVWYHGGRYYNGRLRMSGMREVVVFERGGRYILVDGRRDRHDRYDRDGRYGDRRDREWDD